MSLDDFQYDPVTGWEDEDVFPDYPEASAVRGLFQRLFDQIRDAFNTHKAEDASETVKGHVEFATAAETTTGTDNTRAVHPAGLKVELDKKIKHSLATAVNDFLIASGAGAYAKKTLAETKTILGLGSAAAVNIEEGTFTPVMRGASVAGVNTYTTQTGRYYKIGKLVKADFIIQMTAKDAAMSGQAWISGLPFAIKNIVQAACFALIGNIDLPTGATQFTGSGITNATYIVLYSAGDNVSWSILSAANIKDSTYIEGSITYISD
jgi:hypothetical protein